MPDPVSISKGGIPYKGMDYDALRKEGLRYLQKYSGAVWTDYNHHDPGVTILEYLCFGITDLAYRCNFHVRDLLYSSEYNRQERPSNAFFPPHEILTCAPVTLADLKSFLLDHFKEVLEDMWITPVSDRYGIRGVYDFKLRLKDSLNEEEAGIVIERLKGLYLQYRALGEDIGKVTVLGKKKLSVHSLIEISSEVSPTQVLSNILRNLEKCLIPAVQIRSRDELIASGVAPDELFDGPPPQNGFIVQDTFSDTPDTIYLSALRDAISETEGVLGIRDLRFLVDDIAVFSEQLAVDENTCLTLSPLDNMPGSHQIIFIRNNQEAIAELNVANQMWQAAVAREDQQLHSKKYRPDDPPVSQKRLEDIAAYYSVQQLFPVVYGITSFGIPGTPVPESYVYVRQLKGYLTIFEILLASSMKQITRLKYLFHVESPRRESVSEEPHMDYATQFPFDIPDIDPLLRWGAEDTRRDDTEKALKEMATLGERPLELRMQFLAHLLARFGEVVEPDYVKKIASWKNENPDQVAVRMYSRLISEYVPAGGKRGTGFNYLEQPTDYQPTNRHFSGISVLKSRLCIHLDIPEKADASCTDYFPFENFHKPSSESMPGSIPVKSLLRHGGGVEGYEIIPEAGGWALYFAATSGRGKYRLGASDDKASLVSLRDDFIDRVLRFDDESTNFFIVEHVLLRPLIPPSARLIFRAPLDDGFVLMNSPRYQSPEVFEGWSNNLLAIGSNPDNFGLKPDNEAPLNSFITISADDEEILVSAESYPAKIAQGMISMISRNIIRIMQQDPGEVNSIIGPPDWKTDYIPDGNADEFYSMRLSVVIPDWPSRFSVPDRKRLFERFVLQFAPAHLHIDFLWLNWTQMGQFEDAYFSWRLAKSTPGTSAEVIDFCSRILADFLRRTTEINTV